MTSVTDSKRTGFGDSTAKHLLCLLCAALFASALLACPTLAIGEGNGTNAGTTGSGFMLGNDYLWTGESGSIDGLSIDNDILAAGRSIQIASSQVGGSVRAAAQSISLNDVAVEENVTIAGEKLSVTGGTANVICLAASSATFEGECSELSAFANSTSINGTVTGDAHIAGNTLTIGPDAVITGTLHATVSAEPSIPQSAQIGKLDVTIDNSQVSAQQASGILAGLLSTLSIFFLVMGILGTFVTAILAEWLFRRHTAAAAQMLRTRTGSTIGSGIIGALVAPIAIIILCCLVITLPLAGALALALIAMTVVSCGFAGASVFKLAFPKLERFKVAMIGGAIMGIASAIPFFGTLVNAAAFMYFLGYVLQTIFLSIRKVKPAEGATPEDAGTATSQTAMPEPSEGAGAAASQTAMPEPPK